MCPTELAYRRTAVEGASGFGLLIALYDTLAGNLRRAADAERNNEIEARCREVNHALLVVAHLEDWLGRGKGGQLAGQLAAFYKSLRRKMIEAQTKRSAEIFEQQMALVLDIRQVWQGLEFRTSSSTLEVPAWVQASKYPGAQIVQTQKSSFSWSA